MQGGDEALVAALVAGEPLADERLESLRAFTLALLERARARSTDGLSPEEALEVIAQVAYTTLRQLRRRRVGRADRRRFS